MCNNLAGEERSRYAEIDRAALLCKLAPYVEWTQTWWTTKEQLTFYNTGSYPADSTAPYGMMIKFSKTPSKSPIPGIQTFPYVPVPFLQLNKVKGGVAQMVDYYCGQQVMMIEEMRIIVKKYLHGTDLHGQFLAFVPQAELDRMTPPGQFVYLSRDTMLELREGLVVGALRQKCAKWTST